MSTASTINFKLLTVSSPKMSYLLHERNKILKTVSLNETFSSTLREGGLLITTFTAHRESLYSSGASTYLLELFTNAYYGDIPLAIHLESDKGTSQGTIISLLRESLNKEGNPPYIAEATLSPTSKKYSTNVLSYILDCWFKYITKLAINTSSGKSTLREASALAHLISGRWYLQEIPPCLTSFMKEQLLRYRENELINSL